MEKNPVLLSTAYFPPVSYVSGIISASAFVLEKHENFIKQTYRNRCVILGANGPVHLVIPVEKGRSGKKPVRDIRIFNSLNWQRNHWRTIFSAYNSSPFFEFYKDDIQPCYEKKYTFLFDFNNTLLKTILEILEIPGEISYTETYCKKPVGIRDLRSAVTPSNQPEGTFVPYTQVFSSKFGFIPNLSILDLIFNKGTESIRVLENSFLTRNREDRSH